MTELAATLDDPLFEPLVTRGLRLRNRLVMAPMTRNYSPDGLPPDFAAEYYGRRADHDLGLIVTEGIAIDHPAAVGESGAGGYDVPELDSEAALAGWRKVVERVHGAGAAIFPQLWHQGGVRLDHTGRNKEVHSPRPSGLWGPEATASFFGPDYVARRQSVTRPSTDEEVADLVAAFARSAASAVRAGFDGVALHGAHGYLIDTFFWHLTNRREDRWGGGTLRERAAFGAAVVAAIREAIGDRPIMFRFSQWKLQDYDERMADGPADLAMLLEPLADAGVDIFDASTRKFSAPAFDGSPISLAGWTQKITGKPTMAVGGVGLASDLQSTLSGGSQPEDNLPEARAMLERGECALIGVGRAFLANVDLGSRLRAGAALEPYRIEHYRTQV